MLSNTFIALFFLYQITRDKNKLDGSDVYILDLGLQLFQWNGTGSNKDERNKVIIFLSCFLELNIFYTMQ